MFAEKTAAFKAALTAVLAAAAALLGGADAWLRALVAFSVADYLTGTAKAVLSKSLSSRGAWAGGLRKLLIYVVVALAFALDGLLNTESLLRTLAVCYYIAEEGLSVLENVGACGVKYPKKLAEALAALRKDEKEEKKDGLQ
jgi:toxin secretion/phage lysis holin